MARGYQALGALIVVLGCAGCGRIGFASISTSDASTDSASDGGAIDAALDGGVDGGVDASIDTGIPPDVTVDSGTPVALFAADGIDLFQLDTTTLEATAVARLMLPSGMSSGVTDLAIDSTGQMWGVDGGSTGTLFRVDAVDGRSEVVGPLPSGITTSLAVVPAGVLDASDQLVFANLRELFVIDRGTAMGTSIGTLTGSLTYSGDLTWHPRLGLIATLNGTGTDLLAVISPLTGAETVLGEVGEQFVLGLAIVGDRVIGVARSGIAVEIDPDSGMVLRSVPDMDGPRWQGAASTHLL